MDSTEDEVSTDQEQEPQPSTSAGAAAKLKKSKNLIKKFDKERKFCCSEKKADGKMCTERYTCRSSLNRHIRAVHKKEVFKCELCDKIYSRKQHLDRHVKTEHLKTKLKCDLCDYEGTIQGLEKHKRTKHSKSAFACPICGAAVLDKKELKQHNAKKHREETIENLSERNVQPLVESCPLYSDDEDNLSSHPPLVLSCTTRSVDLEKKRKASSATALMTALFYRESAKDMRSIRTHTLPLNDEEIKLDNNQLALNLCGRFIQRNININLWTGNPADDRTHRLLLENSFVFLGPDSKEKAQAADCVIMLAQMLMDSKKIDTYKADRRRMVIPIKHYEESLFQSVLKDNHMRLICKDKETFRRTENGPYRIVIPEHLSKTDPGKSYGVIYLSYIIVGDNCYFYPGINRDPAWKDSGISSTAHNSDVDKSALGIFKRKLDNEGTAYEEYVKVLYYLLTDDKSLNLNSEAGVIIAFKFCEGKKVKLQMKGLQPLLPLQRELLAHSLNHSAILSYLDKSILNVVDYTAQYVFDCKIKIKTYFPEGEFFHVIRMNEILKYFQPRVLV